MTTPEVLTTAVSNVREFMSRGQREREWRQRCLEQKNLELLSHRLFNRGRSLATRYSESFLRSLSLDLEDGYKVHLSFNQIYTSPDHGIVTISVKDDPTFLNLQMDPIGLSGGMVNRSDLEQQSRVKIRDPKFGFTLEKQFMPIGHPITQQDYDRYSGILDKVENHFKGQVPDQVPDIVKLPPK